MECGRRCPSLPIDVESLPAPLGFALIVPCSESLGHEGSLAVFLIDDGSFPHPLSLPRLYPAPLSLLEPAFPLLSDTK